MPYRFFRRFAKQILISSNILVAMLFLLGCYSHWFNPLQFWLLGFLTLSAFYFWIILLGFIFFWLFVKPRWVIISLLAFGLGFQPMINIVPLRFSTSFSIAKNNQAIRVMSWNVEHFDILEHKTKPENKEKMFDLVNKYQPDIACFQEMVGSDQYPDAINYIPDFLKRLSFTDYYYSYNNKLDFDSKHHYGIILFSRYPILHRQTIMWYPNDYNSIIQYIDILKGQDTFRVFNLHLQSLRFSKANLTYIKKPEFEDEEAIRMSRNIAGKFKVGFLKRKIQADHIKEEIDKSPYPVIVCGDFNDVPNSYAYATIGKNLQNAFAEKGIGLGRTFTGISPTLRIDNIFADNRFEIEQFIRVNKKLSDHFPILTDLVFKK
jgi:endonuclease/exonuclease/phosphatase family metal-dependent hydrolase